MALAAKENGHQGEAWTEPFREGATETIALLTARGAYGHFGKGGELVSTAHWRVDRQKNIAGSGDAPGKSNLQLQKNKAGRPSTMACLIVPDVYFFGIDGPAADNRDAELTRIIRHGLNLSLASWKMTTEVGTQRNRGAVIKIFEVTGDFSSPKPTFVSRQKPVK
jgi:hypothetical protein